MGVMYTVVMYLVPKYIVVVVVVTHDVFALNA